MNIKIFLAGCFFGMSALSVEAQQVWTPDNGDGTFTNPIMWGDWPDPDVIRVGDDFYFVSTSMHYVPGCPIAKSKDLVNWEMVGRHRSGGASPRGAALGILPSRDRRPNPRPSTGSGTVPGGQFDWGGRLLKGNGGARRSARDGRQPSF